MEDSNYIRELASEIRAKVDQSALPNEGLDELFYSYAVLALTKGVEVTNEDVHDAWSAWATKYNPTSDSLVPFDQLPTSVQEDDTRFTKAIREVSSNIEQ